MDNKINAASGISFKAKLVTNLRGRNNIVKPIAERFEQITKNIPGELKIERVPYESASEHLLELTYEGNSYVTRDCQKYLSLDPAKVTKKTIAEIAQKFAESLKALKIESGFYNNSKELNSQILKCRKELNHTRLLRETAREYKLDGMVENYGKKIEKQRRTLEVLMGKRSKMLGVTTKKLDKYRGKGIGLGPYIDTLSDFFRDMFVHEALYK